MNNFSKIPQIVLPGSKSITNRAFLLSALSGGESRIYKPLYSDDTRYMMDVLKVLGYSVNEHSDFVEIGGRPRITPGKTYEFYIGNAGTTIRFLTTFLASLAGGEFVLKGETRMHERPIRGLVTPLQQAGARIEYLGADGFPPLKITGKSLNFETIALDGSKSSQYITSVLLCLAALNPRARVHVEDLVSKPYIDTTLAVLRS
ncbi:MAG: 3-phosphoshikimate 1-carboxyvinyltransferase, partial [Spirochaetae bacterium HGW-Spirochaetae-6]